MRVSVIINNYNYERFLACAVDSALHQTHADVEVIVVDDGSRDGSVTLLGAYGAAITLVAKSNGGQGSAYNAGFERATGQLAVFLDADDWLYPTAASELAAAWKPGVTKLQFRLALVNEQGEALGRTVPRSMHDRDAAALLRRFGTYGSPPGSGNAFDTAFLKSVLPLDALKWRTAADTVPIMLAPLYGQVVSIPSVLGAYRLHRRAGQNELILNNAPEGLWHELDRIQLTKQLVTAELSRRGSLPSEPLLLAPWECRIAALCIRFGGEPPPTVCRPRNLIETIWRSIWRWPEWGWARKGLLSLWTLLLLYAPAVIAARLALKHRQLTGAADPVAG